MYLANVVVVLVVLQDRVRLLLLVAAVWISVPQHRSSLLTFPESFVLFLQTPWLFRLFHAFYVLTLILAARLRCFGIFPRNMFPGLNTGNDSCTRPAADAGLCCPRFGVWSWVMRLKSFVLAPRSGLKILLMISTTWTREQMSCSTRISL